MSGQHARLEPVRQHEGLPLALALSAHVDAHERRELRRRLHAAVMADYSPMSG